MGAKDDGRIDQGSMSCARNWEHLYCPSYGGTLVHSWNVPVDGPRETWRCVCAVV